MKRNTISKTVTEALEGKAGVTVHKMDDDAPKARKADGKAESVAKAHAKRLLQEAAKDAGVFLGASELRDRADNSFRTAALERARELARKGFALNKTSGLHDLHTFYLSGLQAALRERRGEKDKASGYTRRVTSDVGAVLAAVQVGGEIKVYVWPKAIVDGKPQGENVSIDKPSRLPGDVTWKMVKQVETNAHDMLAKLPGNFRDVVSEARRIKRSMGYVNAANEKAKSPISAASMEGLMDKMEDRLTAKTAIKLLAFCISETRSIVAPENHKFYDGAMENALHDFKRALSETIGASAKAGRAASKAEARKAVNQ